MDDNHRPEPGDDDGVGRRWFVLGGAVLAVAGAATGSLVRLARDDQDDVATAGPPPAQLVAAVARERGLIADLDATTGGTAPVRLLLARTRADHAAHLAALSALLADYDPPATASNAPSSAAGTRAAATSAAATGAAGTGAAGTNPGRTVAGSVPASTTITLDPSTGARLTGTPRTLAQLRAAESRAAGAAAASAALLAGRSATLLASISACEASHVEVLR